MARLRRHQKATVKRYNASGAASALPGQSTAQAKDLTSVPAYSPNCEALNLEHLSKSVSDLGPGKTVASDEDKSLAGPPAYSKTASPVVVVVVEKQGPAPGLAIRTKSSLALPDDAATEAQSPAPGIAIRTKSSLALPDDAATEEQNPLLDLPLRTKASAPAERKIGVTPVFEPLPGSIRASRLDQFEIEEAVINAGYQQYLSLYDAEPVGDMKWHYMGEMLKLSIASDDARIAKAAFLAEEEACGGAYTDEAGNLYLLA